MGLGEGVGAAVGVGGGAEVVVVGVEVGEEEGQIPRREERERKLVDESVMMTAFWAVIAMSKPNIVCFCVVGRVWFWGGEEGELGWKNMEEGSLNCCS